MATPEDRNRARARAMRLAVRYATHWDTAPETIAELMPSDPEQQQVLLVALAEALTELASRPQSKTTTAADLWELVAHRAHVLPTAVHSDVLIALAEYAEHVAPTRFAAAAIWTGLDPLVAGHLAAMVLGTLAAQLDLVRHLTSTAGELDPPNAGGKTVPP